MKINVNEMENGEEGERGSVMKSWVGSGVKREVLIGLEQRKDRT